MRDHHRPQRIVWRRIVQAEDFYAEHGYPPIDVPWVVGPAAYHATLPEGTVPYATLGGFLVASGEQSFLHMLLEGEPVGRAQCTTPCFRDEDHDALHDPYFAKVELIDTQDTSGAALMEMIDLAVEFFTRFAPVRIDDIGDGSFDIVGAASEIELGSYGRRTRLGHTWLYGTGLAEPRLERVIETASRIHA